ncbi:MAG: hypothetical protein JWO94_1379 [Verrucomicrobiaceae bacterium]|nr:hypothetical protein [Verrucomicrobiaceae bacterium]
MTLAFCLYLPPTGWALPLAVIVPAAMVFDWKSLMLAAAAVAVVALGFCGWQQHSPGSASGNERVLTVMTFNRGESVGSLQPFKNLIKPDVLLLQEAGNRADRYAKSPGYEDLIYGEGIGEFGLVSRFPITSKELISDGQTTMAARFTIEWDKQSVVLYCMHLPTPRFALRSLEHGAFLWGILGEFGGWAEKRRSYEEWWHHQTFLAQTMLRRAEAETLPCIIAGDSNAPAPGHIHYLLTRKFTDSHEAAGSGCGMSFPGTTHNPLSLGGPWLRIDKILSNAPWRPLWNKAEADRPSQHRAVAAAFALPSK